MTKKMIRFKGAATALFLLTSLSCFSQSVDELISMAKAYHPGLKALRLDYEASLKIADQQTDYPDPIVNLGIGVMPVETRLGPQRFRAGISQPIPWKGLLTAKRDLAQSQAEIKAELDEIQEIDIFYNIRSAYSMLIFLEEKQKVVSQKLEILDVLEELATSNVRSGKGKLSNVLMVKRQRENLLTDQKLIEKQKERPTIMINRLTGRPFDIPIEITEPEALMNDITVYMNKAQTDYPQLLLLEKKTFASQKVVDLIALEEKPKIAVGLEYAWIERRSDVSIADNGRDIFMPMGSVIIPIHKDRYAAKRQEEKLRQESIAAAKEDMKAMYSAEIANAQSAIELAGMTIAKVNSLKNITSETLQLMRQEYAAEGTRFEELLRLELELTEYDLQIALSKYDIHLAQATLKKYE